MRREGWQHGMVMTQTIQPPPLGPLQDTKFINRFDLPPIAGIRTKVPLKPNNHSKYTGKCRKVRCPGCHSHPVSKSRNKAKGAQKLKSYDVSLNHQLVSWRVVDTGGCGSCLGRSATQVLGHLSGQCCDEEDGEYEDNDNETGYGDELEESVEMGEGNEGSSCNFLDDEIDFCQVGFVVEYLDGEDWCVVREM